MSLTETAIAVVGRPTSAAVVPTVSGSPYTPAAIFTADHANPSIASMAAKAAFLAEIAAHKGVATPLCMGIFGPAGSGKSSLLGALLGSVETITAGAKQAGLATPFLADIATVQIVLQPGADPAPSLMYQVFSALQRSHPRLAAEAIHAGSDPRAAAREASDRLAEVRHRLDADQRKLDEASSRQARLVDSVLFDEGGSRVDAYARSNRGRIERSLRGFGFDRDSVTAYKELVREASEPGGPLSRGFGWMRAFWVYRGQTRLVVVALVFFIIAWLLGSLMEDQESLIGSLRAGNGTMGSTADWIAAHGHWLQPIKQVVAFAGLVALALNILRGLRFLQPIAKGTTLLRDDVEARRRDVDNLVALQTRRVDSLGKEVEVASLSAAEAENRLTLGVADKTTHAAAMNNGALRSLQHLDTARSFFATLSAAITSAQGERRGSGDAPSRLVIGLDGFERVTSEEAAAFLDAAHTLLAVPEVILVIAADRAHLSAGLADTDPALATSRLNRVIQIPIQIGRSEARWTGSDALVRAMLRPDTLPEAAGQSVDITRSSLDLAWQSVEGAVIEALAPFAGETPRAVKRFVNLYRIARADPQMRGASTKDLAALAAGLAMQSPGSGTGDDRRALGEAAGAALQGYALDLERHMPALDVARSYASI